MEETEKALAEAVTAYRSAAGDLHEAGLIEEFSALWEIYRGSLGSVMGKLEVGEISAAHQEFSTNSTVDLRQGRGRARRPALELEAEEPARGGARARRLQPRVPADDRARSLGIALCRARRLPLDVAQRDASDPAGQPGDAALTAGDDRSRSSRAARRSDEIGVLIDAVAGYRDALGRSREFAAQAELVRNRLQAAVSNMPVGLCMFDDLQRLIICNDAYRRAVRHSAGADRAGHDAERDVQASRR